MKKQHRCAVVKRKFYFEHNYVRVVPKINPFFTIKNYNVTLFTPSIRKFTYLLQTIFFKSPLLTFPTLSYQYIPLPRP